MPNLKEIDPQKGCFWLAQSCFWLMQIYFIKRCKEEKYEENGEKIFRKISHKLLGQFHLELVCRVAYMERLKYVNLI